MTEDQPRPTPPDALAALKQWESDTGSEASPTEGNAFIDGFHAGRSQLDLQGNYFKLVSASEAQGEAPQALSQFEDWVIEAARQVVAEISLERPRLRTSRIAYIIQAARGGAHPSQDDRVYVGEVLDCPAKSVVEESCICKAGWGHRSIEVGRTRSTPSLPAQNEELVIEIARELYDRFIMGGWEPQDAYGQIREWLSRGSTPSPDPPQKVSEAEVGTESTGRREG